MDVQRGRITVYREPSPDGYQQVTRHTRGSVLSPIAFPDLEPHWVDLFG